MSHYTDAAATKMLATHCCACGRPLVDAVSVNAGMGPDCREKYLVDDGPAENREAANKLVYRIALLRSQEKQSKADKIEILNLAKQVRDLGFFRLADILGKRCAAVQIVKVESVYVVHTPYSPEAAGAWKQIPGRKWDAQAKANVVPATAREALWGLLNKFFKGSLAVGPMGGFVIESK